VLSYSIRRIVLLIPVFFGLSILVFLLLHLAPGDPVIAQLGLHPTPETVARLRHELGLDDPLPVQYLVWLNRTLHGDLGQSLYAHAPVIDLIIQRFPTTLALTLSSITLALAVGLPLGVVSATHRDSVIDNVGRVLAIIGVSVPVFWLGFLLIIAFAVQLRIFPPGGSLNQYGPIALVLPTIALAASFVGVVVRFARAAMLEVLGQDYVRTARAKGLAPRAIEYRHALRNALIPLVTVVGLQVGVLVSGAVLTETVFSLPGLGLLMTNAVAARDYPLILGGVLAVAMLVVVVNLVVDLLYGALDPRIRFS
jgi:ABC-type dipeptide/oligopeptide/nickel transport system permease component